MMRMPHVVAILISLALASTACSAIQSHSVEQPSECAFRTGDLHQSFCRRSMVQLLATPERFYGEPIYTYGYIELGPDGSVGLAPTPATFEANDTIGCIQVRSFDLGPREAPDVMSEQGTYVVQIAGDLSPPVDGLCVGRLSNATITNIRRLDP